MSVRQNPTPHEHDQPWIGGNRKVIEDHIYKGHGYAPSRNPTSDPWEIHRDLHRAEGTPMPTMSSDSNSFSNAHTEEGGEAHRQIYLLEVRVRDLEVLKDNLEARLKVAVQDRDDAREAVSRLQRNTPSYGDHVRQITELLQEVDDLKEEVAEAHREGERQREAKMEVRTARNDAERKLLALQRDLAKAQAQLAFKPLMNGGGQ